MKTFNKAEDVTEEGWYWWCPEFLVKKKQCHLPSSWQIIYIIPGRVDRFGVFKGPLTPPEGREA